MTKKMKTAPVAHTAPAFDKQFNRALAVIKKDLAKPKRGEGQRKAAS